MSARKRKRRVPAKPAMLSFHIPQFCKGEPRQWAAFSDPANELYDIGSSLDGTRREVAAKILEKVARDIRSGRHKASLIISITHAYLRWPHDFAEVGVQAKALRHLAEELERRWNVNRAAVDTASNQTTDAAASIPEQPSGAA